MPGKRFKVGYPPSRAGIRVSTDQTGTKFLVFVYVLCDAL